MKQTKAEARAQRERTRADAAHLRQLVEKAQAERARADRERRESRP
jgi:hypothetical protein